MPGELPRIGGGGAEGRGGGAHSRGGGGARVGVGVPQPGRPPTPDVLIN